MSGRSLSARTELRGAVASVAANIRGQAELRTSFALQVFGMALNNVSFLAIWMLFFLASGPIHGWSVVEVAAAQGLASLAYGIAYSVFGGAFALPEYIRVGALDGLLTSPRILVVRILTSRTHPSALGDALFGLIVLVGALIYGGVSAEQYLIALSIITPSALLFTFVGLATGCMAFLLPDGQGITGRLYELFIMPAITPTGILGGATRVFFLLVIPALAASAVPIEAIRDVSWQTVGLVWAIALAWVGITLLLLRAGVRRYESGNLTGARV